MVEVEMSKDIHDYETKMFGVITMRQLVLLGIGAAYAIPLALIIPGDFTVKIMVAVIALIPMIMLGWVNVFGMKMEKFLGQIIKSTILTPVNRKYIVESSVEYLDREFIKTPEKTIKVTPSADYPAHN